MRDEVSGQSDATGATLLLVPVAPDPPPKPYRILATGRIILLPTKNRATINQFGAGMVRNRTKDLFKSAAGRALARREEERAITFRLRSNDETAAV